MLGCLSDSLMHYRKKAGDRLNENHARYKLLDVPIYFVLKKNGNMYGFVGWVWSVTTYNEKNLI